jgi:hypothetical protein
MLGIAVIVRPAIGGGLDVCFSEIAGVEPRQDRVRIVAEGDAQMIDQGQAAIRLHGGEQGELRIGGAAPDQRSPRIVADAADDRRAEAGRSDHRMRFPPIGAQRLFELVQRRTRQAHHLLAAPDHAQPGQPGGADDDQAARIIVAVGCRAAGQPGVRRLHDDRDIGGHAGLRDAPQLHQRGRLHDRDRRSVAGPVSLAEPRRGARTSEQVAPADDGAQRR